MRKKRRNARGETIPAGRNGLPEATDADLAARRAMFGAWSSAPCEAARKAVEDRVREANERAEKEKAERQRLEREAFRKTPVPPHIEDQPLQTIADSLVEPPAKERVDSRHAQEQAHADLAEAQV